MPLIIGWVLVIVAETAVTIYVARFLSGISYGMAYSATPMYLGEIASDEVRGAIGTLLTVMAKGGILLVFAIGPYVSIEVLAYILLVPTIIFLVTFFWLPESPYFLVGQAKHDDATKSLQWLRARDDVKDELNMISESVRKAKENRGSFKELFVDGNRRSLIIILGLGACQQLCGSQAVIAYSQQIFEKVGSDLGASESSIIMAVIQLIISVLSSSIVDRLGRRPLLLISISGAAICNIIIGLFFFLDNETDIDVKSISWLPITTIMIFIVSYTIGLATVPFALLSEIFPTNVKAIAASMYTIFASAISFGVMKLFQVVSDGLGIHITFWGFALFSFFFVAFVWFLIPETKGKPLDVILEEMNAKAKNKKKESVVA